MTKQIVNLGVANKGNGDPIRTAFDKVNQNFTELYNAIGLGDGNLNIGAFEFSGSTMTTTDSSDIIIAQRTQITSSLTVSGDVLPSVANGGDLGSAARPWRSLYVSNNTIYLGNTPLAVNQSGQLTINGTLVNSIDRLSASGDEVVLTGGANPYVTFPAVTGGDQLIIQGSEVSSVSGHLALTSQNNLYIIANGSGDEPGGSKSWTFGADGSLTIPSDIRSEQAINIDINLGDSTLRRWTFGEDGNLTIPGELHGSPVISGGMFPSQVGRTVNITPANDASDKKFKFRIDQYGETFTRAYFDMPEAEVDKQVAAAFPHANNTVGYIFTQGANINDDGLNNAFNIFYNSGNIKITAMQTGGTGTLRTWTYGADGRLYLPSIGGGGGAILRSPLNESIGISAYNDTGAGTTYTLSVATTGPINIPTASTGLGRLQNPDGIEILTNSGALAKLWAFGDDGKLTFPNGSTIAIEEGGAPTFIIDGGGNYVDIRDSGTILINYNSTGNVQIGGTLTEIVSEQLKFLNQTVPTTSIGVFGDGPGHVAFDATYMYYCAGTYDGVTNIWKRVAWSGDTW